MLILCTLTYRIVVAPTVINSDFFLKATVSFDGLRLLILVNFFRATFISYKPFSKLGKKVVRLMIYELQLLHIFIRSAMLNEFGVYKLYRVSYYFEITSFLRDSII